MAQRKILGIDPGSRHTGFALLLEESGSYRAVECGVINTLHEEHTERLHQIFNDVTAILKRHKPDFCAIETPIYGIDPLAMLKLGRAQAAALLAITNSGFPVSEYYPKAVKKSVTGNGNASKKQVAYMLEKMVSLPEGKLSGDGTDAVAVAWCHFSTLDSRSGVSSARKTHQNNRKGGWEAFIADNPGRVRE